MPTQTKENYLKALYHLHQRNADISITDLGQSLGLSKPTVNDMVKKMHQDGWLEYERYKPIRLTRQGLKHAALVIRKHRLAEMFLVQIMGFGWEEVHDIAEELEHLDSKKLFNRMDELLGFPHVDPHGSPIPDKQGNFSKNNYKTIAECRVGETVALRALKDSSSDFLIFLNKKGLQLGTLLNIVHLEPYDQSINATVGENQTIVFSEKVAKKLLVETV